MPVGTSLAHDGFEGPVRILTAAECRRLTQHLRRAGSDEPAVWEKARALDDRVLYELATRPSILERVTSWIGPDVVLWGVSAVSRDPGQVHPWHSDIESCGPEGGFVSVWIGLENTSRDSSLQLIAGSHRVGRSVQEVRAATGIGREEATPTALVELARAVYTEADLVEPDMTDGEAIFFDGGLWHGTDNRRRRGSRLALLLQFAAADRAVRIPDWVELDWPFRILEEPRPPVIVVSGAARNGANHVVPPPFGWSDRLTTAVHSFDLPLGETPAEPWRPVPAFRGPTATVAEMSCHASVLDGGHSPHPPHAHEEEEILVPIHGQVQLVIASSENDPEPRTERAQPGSFVYYPAGQHHTIHNPGSSPVAYLMFKWRGHARLRDDVLGTEIVRFDDASADADEPFSTHRLLESPTGLLATLHSHLTLLQPRAGYEPHRDEHDVAIVLLGGEIETLGRRVEPLSVVYCSAGELHGMQNPGAELARYLVFEFHGVPGDGQRSRQRPIATRLISKLRRARARRP